MKPQMHADERRSSAQNFSLYLRASACICGFILLLLTGCDSKDASSSSGAQKVTLQLNWKPEPQFGPFYAAKELAAKHNLDIEVVPGGVGTPTVQMVAAGKVPFAVVSADELIISRSNGADVVALFAVYQTNPQGLMTHAKRGLKSIGDIFTNPGTIAMQRGLPYASFLEKKFGFDKVKIVPSPGGDLSAFRNDPNFSMQCFVTSERSLRRRPGLTCRPFSSPTPATTLTRPSSSPARITGQKNPKIVQSDGRRRARRLPRVSRRSDRRPTRPCSSSTRAMDAETFTAAAEAQKPLIETDETKKSGLGVMTLERWEALCKQLVELKVVEKAPPASECFVSN
jgi:NitT/TauT family transport system substrate-binding protein